MKNKRSSLWVALWISGFLLVLLIGMLLGSILERTNEIRQNEEYLEEIEPAIYTQSQMNAQKAQMEDEFQEKLEEEVESQLSTAVDNAREEGSGWVLDFIRNALLEDKSTVEVLRALYLSQRQIVLVSDGKYHFVPIIEELRQNHWNLDNVEELDTGEKLYYEKEELISHKGIDVSQFQGKIDWEKVAKDGVEFTFIRAFFRGYGSGALVDDTYFEDNIEGAISNNIHTGVYFFTQAINKEEALEEVAKVVDMVSPYAVGIPIAVDVERVAGKHPRMDDITVEERTEIIALICDEIAKAGYIPYIYHNTEMGILFLDLEKLEGYKKWFASYARDMFYPYEYGIWQYSDHGSVDGIKDEVDLNISFSAFWEE